MIQFIYPIVFFISLFVGLLYVYMFTPLPDIIIKYPTPDNTESIRYKDKADNCYRYKTTEVECSKHKDKKFIDIPIQ